MKTKFTKFISTSLKSLFLLGSIFFFNSLQAATINFTGATNNDWATASNWSPATVPTSADVAYINGSKTVIISAPTAVTVQRISMGTGASLVNNGTLNIIPTGITVTSGPLYLGGTNSFTNNGTLVISNTSQTGNYNLMTFAGTGNTVTFNGSNDLSAKTSTSIFVANSSSSATISGTGLTIGNNSTGVVYSIFSTTGANSSFTINPGTTLNLYIGASGNGFYMANNASIINNGTITATAAGSVSGRALNIWQTTSAVSANFTNNGTFNMIGFDAPTVMGGSTGYCSLNNTGTLNIQNNTATSTIGLNLASSNLPNVFTNSGTLNIYSKTNAISLPAASYGPSFTNSGTITITRGNISSSASAGSFPVLNNNSGGIFNFNYGTPTGSTTATSNVLLKNNSGGIMRGSCAFAANTLATNTGSTLSPGDYNTGTNTSGIGIMILNNPVSGTKFPLSGTLDMQINGKTTPGTDFDQLLCNEIDITNANLQATVNYSPVKSDYIGLVYASVSKTSPFATTTIPSGWLNNNSATTTALVYYPTATVSTSTKVSDILSSLNAQTSVTVTGQGNLLEIDNSITVNSITVENGGALTLKSGNTLTVGTLTLKSDATNGTSTFVDEGGTQNITNAAVEQYLTSGRNWYLSSPISNATTTALSSASSVVYYNEPTASWVTLANGADLNPVKGYISTGTISSGTITYNGALNTGSKSITLSRTGSTSKSGFELVGNPYPSYLNWDLATRTNIEPTIWYRTQSVTSYVFDTYNAVSKVNTNLGSTPVTKYIPPMQAFWVRVLAGQTSGTLSLNNTMRTHADIATNRLKSPANNSNQKVLRLEISNNLNKDEAIVVFNPDASDTYDAYDSPKMSNNNILIPEISTINGNENLVINGMSNNALNSVVPLHFYAGKAGDYTLKATELTNFNSDSKIILRDNLLSIDKELTEGIDYKFSSEATNTPNRFSLIFRTVNATTQLENTNKVSNAIRIIKDLNNRIQVYCNKISDKNSCVVVFSSNGQELVRRQILTSQTTIEYPFSKGVYIIKVMNGGNTRANNIIIN